MENELDYVKNRLEQVNFELKYFWEDHLHESDPSKILVYWGRLVCLMELKLNAEMDIERLEEELNHEK